MTISTQKDKRDYYSEQDKPKQLETMKTFTLIIKNGKEDKFLFELGKLGIKCPTIHKQWDRTLFDFQIESFSQQLQIERLRIDLGL
jgi:hypothetical protein